ncbi:MAG: GIY-YIG nuclease family protein [bacterium]
MWFVYILECKNKSLYTGVTNNIERRFKEHLNKKAHYTSYNAPVKLAYKETYQTRSKALKREAQIKRWTRRKKIALINGDLFLLKRL